MNPPVGLDPNQIIDIRELIRSLGKDKTVLFSSHILQEVEAICDRVIIINKGMLVADDSVDNLQRKGKSSNVVYIQFKEDLEPSVFNDLPHITALKKGSGGNWEIQTPQPEEIKKALMELSLRNKLNIVSLQSENQSLEEVFRQLVEKVRL